MRYFFLFFFLRQSLVLAAQDFSLYEKYHYNAPELNMSYRLLRPLQEDSSSKYPLLIFLHGAGARGFDNEAQLSIGGNFFLRDSIRKNYPAFILFPQCPEWDTWAFFENREGTSEKPNLYFPFKNKPSTTGGVLLQLIDSLVHTLGIDAHRIYLMGYSQGGMGVLDLLARKPGWFAAGISISGAGNVASVKNFAGQSALWLFHGDADEVIPVDYSRAYYKRLKKLNAEVLYTEYPLVGHNCWAKAFSEPRLLSWLFSIHKT
jgi:predicted peptidase